MTLQFDQTVRDYTGAMKIHAWRRCRDGSVDPEELIQEAWLQVWLSWPLVRDAEKPAGLILRILHQTATAMWKKSTAIMRTGQTVPVDEFNGGWVEPSQDAAFDLKRVSERLDTIPQRQRDVLVSRALGDSLAEVGGRLGVGGERVRQIEAQARKRLLSPRISRNS